MDFLPLALAACAAPVLQSGALPGPGPDAGQSTLARPASRPASQLASEAEDAWAPHRKLKILYAGDLEGSRAKVFDEFLKEWFDQVQSIDLTKLDKQSAEPFDVVIADWKSQYGNDGFEKPQGLHGTPTQLGLDFDKPIITMDYLAEGLRSEDKLNWL